MAATLKLGNANWAAKEGSLLAYNDENDNFKPLPFDFTRASSATYVASDGLIKTSTTGQPRIDFLGNTNGALLLEPQRTNLITYSEDFSNSYWTKSGASVTSGIVSPDGTANAYKLVEDTSTAKHRVFTTITGTSNTFSFFAKADGRNWVSVLSNNGNNSFFDVGNGVVGTVSAGSIGKIESLIDGWYRCTLYNTHGTFGAYIGLAESNNSDTYQGNGTSGVYIYGAQLEAGTYPTSYIPTSGSTVTRVAETCSQTPASGVIGQTEGTIYVKYNFDATIDNSGGSDRDIVSISTNSSNNIKIVHYGNGSSSYNKKVYLYSVVGGSYVVTISSPTQSSGLMKVACGYKNNDYVLYVNGVQIGTDTSASVPTCSIVGLGKLSNILTPTPINETKLYNTRLSNSELATLTTI